MHISSNQAQGLRVLRPRQSYVVTALWALACAFGLFLLARYASAAGPPADAPSVLPAETNLPLAADRWNLLVFAHPRCPCSRASLSELARLTTRAGDDLRATVVFYQPSDKNASWAHADLWLKAMREPNMQAWHDRDGMETSSFGAFTSGQALLYNPKGALVFKGGLTPSRGHEGLNSGVQAIYRHLEGKTARAASPVYGCPILGDDCPETF